MRTKTSTRGIVFALMIPLAMTLINRAMFSVALPGIRAEFGLQADSTAWMITVYSLAFVIGMPLYGRLADMLNRRFVLLTGVLLFGGGTVLCLVGNKVWFLLVGRIIQGLGAASATPLSMAIITSAVPIEQRGRALGTWTSIGPVCFMTGPLLAGLIVDALGWRSILGPVLLIGVLAVAVPLRWIPQKTDFKPETGTFDWPGLGLLAAANALFVFFVSSRPITGIEPLRDWRLAIGAVLMVGAFIWRQKKTSSPLVLLRLFRYAGFAGASVVAGIRMLSMGVVAVITPLMLRDVFARPSTTAGIFLMLHSGFLLLTLRVGGSLADRYRSRPLVLIGLGAQCLVMALLATLGANIAWLLAGLILHGLATGLSLVPLHRAAMGTVPTGETGRAAGLYSMLRFTGTMLGSSLAGVVLQQGLARYGVGPEAYLTTFWVASGFSFVGALIASRLKA